MLMTVHHCFLASSISPFRSCRCLHTCSGPHSSGRFRSSPAMTGRRVLRRPSKALLWLGEHKGSRTCGTSASLHTSTVRWCPTPVYWPLVQCGLPNAAGRTTRLTRWPQTELNRAGGRPLRTARPVDTSTTALRVASWLPRSSLSQHRGRSSRPSASAGTARKACGWYLCAVPAQGAGGASSRPRLGRPVPAASLAASIGTVYHHLTIVLSACSQSS